MFLEIKNIGKALDTKIELKGITVIAGENNTGKSTFGKALYCMFSTFCNVDKKIHNERFNEVRRIFQNSLPRIPIRLQKSMVEDILANNNPQETAKGIIESQFPANQQPDSNVISAFLENLNRSVSIGNNEIHKTIITRCFWKEFDGQVNHVNKPDISGTVSLEIKGKKIEVRIKANECAHFEDNIGLLHEAIYIDTPFIMDDIKNIFSERDFFGFYNMVMHRDDLLARLIKGKSANTIIEEVITKQKINNLLSNIHSIVNGEFKEDKDSLLFSEQGLSRPLPLSNVSTGIKMFLIIKRLLESGEIREKDILIFDEPEIHLHPDWQLRFAEILVLLQKEFNLTILLTTHSPYFLRAIEVYAEKHEGMNDKLKIYLAESENDVSKITDVTENVDIVYKQLAQPFQTLENLRYGN